MSSAAVGRGVRTLHMRAKVKHTYEAMLHLYTIQDKPLDQSASPGSGLQVTLLLRPLIGTYRSAHRVVSTRSGWQRSS